MPNTHCGKHNKLSKTLGSPLDSMEEIISSQCPCARLGQLNQVKHPCNF